jgi:hypothetical protein
VKSRRGSEKYLENPFLKQALDNAIVKKKKTNLKTEATIMIKDEDVNVPVGFHTTKEVEATQFVKIYLAGIKALTGLNSAGLKVFEIVYKELMGNPHKTEIILNYELLESKMGRTTFFNGIKELIKHNFLAESVATGLYYVNIAYIYNGDRIAMIQEYRIKRTKNAVDDIRKMESKYDLETGEILD